MNTDLQALKDFLDLRALVLDTHFIDRSGKAHCPNPDHPDRKPSCHIYPRRFKCFSCGLSGDHVDWLELVHGVSTAGAIEKLKRRVAVPYYGPVAQRTVQAPASPTFRRIPDHLLADHLRRAARLERLPQAVQGRGFTLEDLRRFGFAAAGDDAVFSLPGPDGTVYALKKRFAEPRGGQRYEYVTPGHGTPAWCSPGFLEREIVLAVEGELNGMACYLAAPQLGVMGMAGAGGGLHALALRGRKVYVYADDDAPGRKARDRWAAQALQAGAAEVYVLDPWPADACDIAGREGLAALRKRLT